MNAGPVSRLLLVTTATSLAIAGGAASAHADGIAYTCHAEPAPGIEVATITTKDNRCSGFVVRRAGKVVQEARGLALGSGGFLTSSDGRTVVFLQHYPLAHLDAHGLIRTFDGKALDGVVIVRDGKEVTRIALDTFVSSGADMLETVSHVLWVRSFDPVVSRTWKVTTNAGTVFAIDTATGRVTAAAPSRK